MIDSVYDDVSISIIEEGLYLGNLSAALDTKTLERYRISHILTIESRPLPDNIKSIPGMKFLQFSVHDMAHEDLLSNFTQITEFISDGQMKGNVLVHCYFGMSRSATGVIAYLMKKYNITYNEAYQRAKSKRKFVSPNSGFESQLLLYERMHCKLDTSNVAYKLYLLQCASDAFRNASFDNKKFQDSLINEVPEISASSSTDIKCKACRSKLFSQSNIIHHSSGTELKWTTYDLDFTQEREKICTKGIFVMPSTWMANIFTSPHGKILCQKCGHKLGSFNWIKGCECPCNSAVRPGFIIVPSKVDRLS